jgi:hypothetical protein
MTYNEFLNEVIEGGIAGATADYTKPEDKSRLEGAIAGFNACRDKRPNELIEIYNEAGEYMKGCYGNGEVEKYWWFRCYQLEVEWVMNCVSCLLYNEGQPPLLSWLPTCNAMQRVAAIVGVKKENE